MNKYYNEKLTKVIEENALTLLEDWKKAFLQAEQDYVRERLALLKEIISVIPLEKEMVLIPSIQTDYPLSDLQTSLYKVPSIQELKPDLEQDK